MECWSQLLRWIPGQNLLVTPAHDVHLGETVLVDPATGDWRTWTPGSVPAERLGFGDATRGLVAYAVHADGSSMVDDPCDVWVASAERADACVVTRWSPYPGASAEGPALAFVPGEGSSRLLIRRVFACSIC